MQLLALALTTLLVSVLAKEYSEGQQGKREQNGAAQPSPDFNYATASPAYLKGGPQPQYYTQQELSKYLSAAESYVTAQQQQPQQPQYEYVQPQQYLAPQSKYATAQPSAGSKIYAAPAPTPIQFSPASEVSSFKFTSPLVTYSNHGVLSQFSGKSAAAQPTPSQQQVAYPTPQKATYVGPQAAAAPQAYTIPAQQKAYSGAASQLAYSSGPQKVVYASQPQFVHIPAGAGGPQPVAYSASQAQDAYAIPQHQLQQLQYQQYQQSAPQHVIYQQVPQQAYQSAPQHQQYQYVPASQAESASQQQQSYATPQQLQKYAQ